MDKIVIFHRMMMLGVWNRSTSQLDGIDTAFCFLHLLLYVARVFLKRWKNPCNIDLAKSEIN